MEKHIHNDNNNNDNDNTDIDNNDDITKLFNELTISKIENNDIKDKYEKSNIQKWIKLLPLDKSYYFSTYKRKDYFIHVADIILDIELNKQNEKKRNTLIQFVPVIEKHIFDEKAEYIYIFVVNECIVKIGGTRTGLKGRVSSYLCGHHIEERGKSGDCSKTNGYIYNTFYFYLCNNANIKMYAYKIPTIKHTCNILDENVEIILQTYHAYESMFLSDFKKIYGEYPILCDNSDPDYR